jgi:hypothetical protein
MGQRINSLSFSFLIPNVGEVIPNVGEVIPNVGEVIPNVGEVIPNVGEVIPNVGEEKEKELDTNNRQNNKVLN